MIERGCELWARDDVQARIGLLSAEEEARREDLVARLRQQHDELYAQLVEHEQLGAATRLLLHRWRFEKEVAAAQTWAERERLHEELREEVRAELRAELRAEVRAELVEELRKDLVEGLGRELREELRREMRAEMRGKVKAAAAAPGPGVTNHDIPARFGAPVPAAPLAVVAPRAAGSLKARLRDLPLPISADALAMAG